MPNVVPLESSTAKAERLQREELLRQFQNAQRKRHDIDAFQSEFEPLPAGTPIPVMTWEELRRQLEALAANRQTRSMVHHLLESARIEAVWKTPEMVARRLVLVIGLVMDEQYEPADTLEPCEDYGEAPMP